MIITIAPPLPCAQFQNEGGAHLCGKAATQALVTMVPGEVWEMLPVCEEHLHEATSDQDESLPLTREAGA